MVALFVLLLRKGGMLTVWVVNITHGGQVHTRSCITGPHVSLSVVTCIHSDSIGPRECFSCRGHCSGSQSAGDHASRTHSDA